MLDRYVWTANADIQFILAQGYGFQQNENAEEQPPA